MTLKPTDNNRIPTGTIHYLQTSEWLNLRSHGLGIESFYEVLNLDPRATVVGHIALKKRSRFSRRRRFLEVFYGPYIDLSKTDPEFEAQVLVKLLKAAKGRDCDFIRLMAYEGESDRYLSLDRLECALKAISVPYVKNFFETSIYDLDLHAKGELLKSSNSSKKNLRHAAKLKIVELKTKEEIRLFFKEVHRIKGRKKPKESELESNAKYSSQRFLLVAQEPSSGKCVGTLGFIHDDYMATEIASSTLKGPETRGVQEKLHLHAFDLAKENGLRKFDLAGLERNVDGSLNSIARFKLKFGGEIARGGFIEIGINGKDDYQSNSRTVF